jgi:hypothetical protein
MSCRRLDVPCQIWNAIEPFWFWIQAGFWGIVILLALWGLAKVKEIGGWPAVAAALGAGAYGFGWFRGRRGKPLIPRADNPTDIDGPDADPPPPRPRPKREPIFPNAPWNRRH